MKLRNWECLLIELNIKMQTIGDRKFYYELLFSPSIKINNFIKVKLPSIHNTYGDFNSKSWGYNIGHQKRKNYSFQSQHITIIIIHQYSCLIGQDGSIFHRIQSDQKSCNGCLQHCHTQNLWQTCTHSWHIYHQACCSLSFSNKITW